MRSHTTATVQQYVEFYSLLAIAAVEHAMREFQCVLGMRLRAPLSGWGIRNVPDMHTIRLSAAHISLSVSLASIDASL